LRGEGRGEGLLLQLGHEELKHSIDVLGDFIVPDADHAIAKGAEITIAPLIRIALRVLTAIEFDNEAPFATNEIHIIGTNRLLAGELEPAELPIAKLAPKL